MHVTYLLGDCSKEQTAIDTVDLAVKEFGKVDILVNNVGIGRLIKLVDSTADDYDELMDTNAHSTFFFSKYAVIDMLKRHEGRIIMVSSVTGHIGHEDETIYTMTKFAQRGLAQAISRELESEGIKACAICPSATKTEFEVGFGRTEEGVAASKWETAEDVAKGILSMRVRPKMWYGKSECDNGFINRQNEGGNPYDRVRKAGSWIGIFFLG